tara:strand:- start:20 stop:532 length:513 start_codon:yes stop_codon:yes gene_type:complete
MSTANYGNSIIYKLCCNDIEITDEYVGSTVNFNQRECQHRTVCSNASNLNTKYNMKVYVIIRENGGFENWNMVAIEEYTATDKRDLHKRERYWFDELKPTLNMQTPSRTKKEYHQDHKEKDKRYKKQYYQDNREKLQQKSDCPCGGRYTHGSKSRHLNTIRHQQYVNQNN